MQLSSFSQFTGLLWLGGVALWAQAQTPTPAPASATQPVPLPTLVYDSPLTRYRPYQEAQVQDWGASNQTVHQIGGWRAYAQEAPAGANAHRHGGTEPAQSGPGPGAHQGHRP